MSILKPLPSLLSVFVQSLMYTQTFRLLSFSVTLRLECDLDLIAEGLLKDFPEEDLIM